MENIELRIPPGARPADLVLELQRLQLFAPGVTFFRIHMKMLEEGMANRTLTWLGKIKENVWKRRSTLDAVLKGNW